MNCKLLGVFSKIIQTSQPAIVKGSDAFIVTQNFVKGDGCDKVSEFDSFVGATGFLKNDDGTTQNINGILQSSDMGTLRFDIAASGTELLKSSDESSFEFCYQDANGVKYIQFDGKLQIKDRIF